MQDNNSIIYLNCVEDLNNYFGVETLHPQIMVLNLNNVDVIKHIPKQFDIYSIACYWNIDEQDANNETEISLVFYAPGYYGKASVGTTHNPSGYVLAFDRELLCDTLLQNRVDEYPFFSNNSSNVISLRPEERDMVVNCMRSINEEIHNTRDQYSSHILAAGIHALLSVCMRYYERQTQKPHNSAVSIITRLNNILDIYSHTPAHRDKQIPTVASCASELGLSPNYLGDVVRNTTKISAHTYIHRFIVNEVKRLLEYTSMNIGQVAYQLGFKYPHHLTRIFKKETGMTPGQFRSRKRQK